MADTQVEGADNAKHSFPPGGQPDKLIRCLELSQTRLDFGSLC